MFSLETSSFQVDLEFLENISYDFSCFLACLRGAPNSLMGTQSLLRHEGDSVTAETWRTQNRGRLFPSLWPDSLSCSQPGSLSAFVTLCSGLCVALLSCHRHCLKRLLARRCPGAPGKAAQQPMWQLPVTFMSFFAWER